MREVVVLLVGPTSLPGRLEEVLFEKGMFVESCEIEQASGTLLVSTPDVVIAGHEKVNEVARAVRGASDSASLRLLVMAPRGEVSKLRRNLPDEVTAVLPLDLPPAAVAVRVKTVIKKGAREVKKMPLSRERPSAEASPLRKVNESAGEARAGKVVGRSAAVAKGAPVSPTGKTLPHISAIPGSPAVPSTSRAPRAAKAFNKESTGLAGRKSPPPAPLVLPQTLGSPSAAQRISLRVSATSLPALRIALLDEDVTRADAISSSLRESGHEVFLVSGRTGRSRWHLLRKFAPQAIVVDETGLSHDGGAWITAFRSDHFLQATPLVAVALENLFDEEEGKADLGHLEPQLDGLGRTELTFLAQFGPGRELEVNLAQIGFARLLSLVAESGRPTTLEVQSRTESLLWNIVSGSADTATLKSGASAIELGARQALDWTLGHASAQVLVRPEEGLRLRAGVLVDELLKDAYRSNLPPDAAFSAPVALGSEPASSLGRAALNPAPEHSSGSFGDSNLDSIPPDSELPTQPIALSDLPALSNSQAEAPPLPQSDESPQAGLGATPDVEDGQETARFEHQESNYVPVTKESLPRSSVRRNTPPGVVRAVVGPQKTSGGSVDRIRWIGAAAAFVLVGGISTWLLASGDSSTGEKTASAADGSTDGEADDRIGQDEVPAPEVVEASPEPEKTDPEPSAEPKEPIYPEETSVSADLWRVRNTAKMNDCDVLLERPLDYYTSQPEWVGEKIWKRARHQLLIGEREAANRLMCQAAFIDPDGRASVGLGEYYLANRSLETAKEWAQYGIEQRPDGSRASQELLGDVYSQMGLPEKAKEQWLETMKLEPDDLPKMRTVARTLARLGHKARRGGDASLAERLFRRAATLDEDSADASGGLSGALLKNGEPELAEKWARRTLSLDASSGDALLVLGDLARERGEIEAARREYREIKEGTAAYRAAQDRLDQL